jgi:hypothetical protein
MTKRRRFKLANIIKLTPVFRSLLIRHSLSEPFISEIIPPTCIIVFYQLVPTELEQFFADSEELVRFKQELHAENILAEVEVEEPYEGTS